jgi:hypothetical protein
MTDTTPPIENFLTRLFVWGHADFIPDRDAQVWRSDAYGNVMRFGDYGDRQSQFGWELDHWPVPASLGGTDNVTNLRALHWSANARHGGLLGGLLGV